MKSAPTVTADVCLILEGTYPYVSGGVSTWVHQIISALPELKFSILFIGSEHNPEAKYKYTLPPNVTSVTETYLFDPKAAARKQKPQSLSPAAVAPVLDGLRALLTGAFESPDEAAVFTRLLEAAAKLGRTTTFDSFWKDPATFELVASAYHRFVPAESFLDFFWTVRFLLEPCWRLVSDLHRLPPAKVYHSLCTGYAGLAGAFAARSRSVPFLLSEHGIYVKERIADIQKSRWIYEASALRPGLFQKPSALRALWIEFFRLLGRYSYDSSSRITSLFQKNATLQVEFGAAADRIDIIPNGVEMSKFDALRHEHARLRAEDPGRSVVGFLGRIVSIKDVKTLLKAAGLIHATRPDVQFLLAGPTDEDPAYFRECEAIVERAGLGQVVKFSGSMTLQEFLPAVDLVVLSSVSEGLPFVVLEGFAAGLPLVTTDVGACRELLEGRPGESPAHGTGGFVTPIGDAERLADAILVLVNDPALAARMGEAGRSRTTALYAQQDVVRKFKELYLSLH